MVTASPLKQSVSRTPVKGAVKPGTTPAASRAKKDAPSAFKAPKVPTATAKQPASEAVAEEAPHAQEVNTSEADSHTADATVEEPVHTDAEVVSEDQHHEEVVDHAQESSHDTTSESVEFTTPVESEAPPNVQVGGANDDIEAMVNLLESVNISKPRPQSIVSIPDEEI